MVLIKVRNDFQIFSITLFNSCLCSTSLSLKHLSGNTILIHRIKFLPEDRSLPIEMERSQFPIRPSFSVTSNKSQGREKYNSLNIQTTTFIIPFRDNERVIKILKNSLLLKALNSALKCLSHFYFLLV